MVLLSAANVAVTVLGIIVTALSVVWHHRTSRRTVPDQRAAARAAVRLHRYQTELRVRQAMAEIDAHTAFVRSLDISDESS